MPFWYFIEFLQFHQVSKSHLSFDSDTTDLLSSVKVVILHENFEIVTESVEIVILSKFVSVLIIEHKVIQKSVKFTSKF